MVLIRRCVDKALLGAAGRFMEPAEESLRAEIPRPVQDLGGAALLDNLSRVHEYHAVGDVAREPVCTENYIRT